ncbi:Peptidase family M23 [Seinonella peptonophila]|uniref:Peptidase family M23 n=1 Tax=Seinonella peptonophila TaxID=112248 RepID=A0A1M5AY83_9BACL|nr:peptidoglycan DD-metalloendopeptidase family protein [Seinonella peptonophila]SHF34872.1 Peptidase family M23 [Seinonella peptonophila]
MEPLIKDRVKKVSKTKRLIKWILIWKYPLLFLTLFLVPIMIPIGFLFVLFILSSVSSAPNHQEQVVQGAVSSHFPSVAASYLPIYQTAGKKYRVPWNILAAIHKVETNFGQNLSVSTAGAKGQTQFMEKTWLGWRYPGGNRLGNLPDYINITDPKQIAKYGGYGVDANGDGKAEPSDPMDAIYATAKYLSANHRSGEDWFSQKGAVWQYNHDYSRYVLKVKKYAEEFIDPKITSTDSFLFPVQGGQITSQFGSRRHPIQKIVRQHDGVDIAKERGTPILAAEQGEVVESRPSSGYGWKIVVQHVNGFKTTYAHMYPQDVKVKVGQVVQKGEIIALVGSNGWSTGPHLHFEAEKDGQLIDPMYLFKK